MKAGMKADMRREHIVSIAEVPERVSRGNHASYTSDGNDSS